ncbi:membrane protein insertase YidC [Microbacterium sp. 18062]|uniref:YidC/Oxa1 family membrane protein insertase n=1 Tax=Microbacterium sp. 18062 TaxID=2681410 RepID=UPI001359C295|nr:membrane protein insertase YidC [Microbacterium sp. 18062]
MDLFAFPPLAAVLDLTYRGLVALTTLLEPVSGAWAAASAVVLVTLLVRAALIPTGIAQARAEQVRARLAPRLRDLQKRWRSSPERLQRETMQLYRDENASPFSGCLPVLVQTPVVGVLYAVFLHPAIAGRSNALLVQTVSGVPLGSSLAGSVADGALEPATVAVFGGMVLIIAIVAEATRRLFRPSVESSAAMPALPMRVIGILPFATAVVAMFVPLAAGIYLAVTVTWTLVQRVVLRRRFPLDPS